MSKRSKRKYYAKLRQREREKRQKDKVYSRLACELYQAMDKHLHKDPTGKKAISNMKRRLEL